MIKIPEAVVGMINAGALFVLNDSGGKDSQAMRVALTRTIPAAQKLVVHATLGDIEWPGALEHAEAGAVRDNIPFIVAKATKTFFEMVDHRFKTRPESPCWPSSACRQCTSDLKRGPIEREIRRELKRRGLKTVVNCVGIRADESNDRAKLCDWKRSERNSKAGRDWWEWLPIYRYSRSDVFAAISAAGESPHWAYDAGNDRLSCMFCIFGSKNDLRNAAVYSPDLYRQYVLKERETGYTMHMSRLPLPQLTGIDV